mgnify:CR=1 FL=1
MDLRSDNVASYKEDGFDNQNQIGTHCTNSSSDEVIIMKSDRMGNSCNEQDASDWPKNSFINHASFDKAKQKNSQRNEFSKVRMCSNSHF